MTSQNPKPLSVTAAKDQGCCTCLKVMTWIYLLLIGLCGWFWMAVHGSFKLYFLTEPRYLSVTGLTPACICFFGFGGLMSLSSSSKKAGITMALIFYGLVHDLTFFLIFVDWIWAFIDYFGGYRTINVPGYLYWGDLVIVSDLRLLICFGVWIGKYLLKKIHKEAMTEKSVHE